MIITHKKFEVPKSDMFIPLHVGKKGKADLGFLGDDTGDNISEKNPNYCELTGLYWMWKNLKDADYIGLCHYRRYFVKPKMRNSLKYKMDLNIKKIDGLFKNKKVWLERKISIKSADKLEKFVKESENFLNEELKNFDAITLKEFELNKSLKELYAAALIAKDLDILRDIVEEKYPEYITEFDNFINQNKMSPCNMFIAKKEIFNDYSKWLFDILFEVEKRVKISDDPYKARVFGFMGEYLLNIYFNYHKEYKIGKMDMLYIK